jgi:hypothetical protein
MVGYVRELEISEEIKHRDLFMKRMMSNLGGEKDALIQELVVALKHAQEALFWHEGMDFEMDGRKAGHAIADALASASRHEARK